MQCAKAILECHLCCMGGAGVTATLTAVHVALLHAHAPHEARVRVAQFLYAGKKATLHIGNILPVGDMPEGTIICNVEEVRACRLWVHEFCRHLPA